MTEPIASRTIDDVLREEVALTPILQYFSYGHLPPGLKECSEMFAGVAARVVLNLPAGPERTACLRKLLEAKDCAVRAMLPPVTPG